MSHKNNKIDIIVENSQQYNVEKHEFRLVSLVT